MNILDIDHYNLRAEPELLDKLRDFYCSVVGLRIGKRPNLRSSGYWLYAGNKAVLHLSQAKPDEIRQAHVNGTFDHVAFSCSDLQAFELHLNRLGIQYRKSQIADTMQTQLFLSDPAGNGVELNFLP
ncbi:diguanylate cyclase [Methylococcaceae bacterium]|nr:diguanylate cyclase [Methylococcaceae bacterium]